MAESGIAAQGQQQDLYYQRALVHPFLVSVVVRMTAEAFDRTPHVIPSTVNTITSAKGPLGKAG